MNSMDELYDEYFENASVNFPVDPNDFCHIEEFNNEYGAYRCRVDSECRGKRTCNSEGWCDGTSYCQRFHYCHVEELEGAICSEDLHCRGIRSCN